MNRQMITREQVIALAMRMPREKLISWYEYGLFIQNHPVFTAAIEPADAMDADLRAEIAA
jgi:hypothetical protein